MAEPTTEYIRKHLRHTHPEKSIGILLERVDSAERRCAELEKEVAFWLSEGQDDRPEVIEYRALAGKKNRTDAETQRLKELAQAFMNESRTMPELHRRIAELEAIVEKHNLCHDLHGKVGRDEFEEGCRRETIKEFGSCGWAERIAELEKDNEKVRGELREHDARIAELEQELEEARNEASYWESEACHGRS